MNKKSKLRAAKLSAWASTSALALAPPTAMAQVAGVQRPTPQSSAESGVENDIVVTGTRILNGADAPTPVSVISAEEIRKAAPTTIADYVNQFPALFGSNNPRNTNTLIGGDRAGANILNLRNLGPNRTLTLFNGRRVPPSFLSGVTDVNTLPNDVIKRVDIVTGGASAAWGSDAVSGVVNFILDEDYTGFRTKIQSGASTRGDAETISASASYGQSFASGRGHLILSGDYSKARPAITANRGWFKGYKIFANPLFVTGNGQPARLILPNSSVLLNGAGLVASGPLRGLQFDPNGQPLPQPFNFGTVQSGIFVSGADTEDPAQFAEIQTPLEQGVAFGRLSYEFSPRFELFTELAFAKTRSSVLGASFVRFGNVSVPIDNAYLPPSVAAQMTTAGLTRLPLSGSYKRFGNPQAVYDREALRYLVGFKSRLSDSWSVDGYLQRGESDIDIAARNNMRPARFNLAFDAVTSNGQIICRSTLTSPGNGCVPFNPFGTAPLTDAQRDYLIGVSAQSQDIREDVAAITVNGELLKLPGGVLSTAFGLEYRKESATADADAESIANAFYIGNYKPFDGDYSVREAFVEFLAPVLGDSPIGRLELNAAVRAVDYTTSGFEAPWKVGFTYEPWADLRLRATRSRDIRAPNLNELFLGGQTNFILLSDPAKNNVSVVVPLITSGNSRLKPEKADTLTIGAVYSPAWLDRMVMSLDFYEIKIKDAIFTPSAPQVLSFCAAGIDASCALTSRDAAGNLTQVRSTPINTLQELARGVDVEVAYRFDVANPFSDSPGTLNLRVLGNYVDKLKISGLLTDIGRDGEVGTNLGSAQGVPRFRALASLSYNASPITAQFKGRLIGKSKIEADWGPLDVNRNNVPAVFYLDTFVGFDVHRADRKMQFYIAIDNLLDRDPPVSVSQDNINPISTGANTFVYDALGRMWKVGVRLDF